MIQLNRLKLSMELKYLQPRIDIYINIYIQLYISLPSMIFYCKIYADEWSLEGLRFVFAVCMYDVDE